MSEKCYPPLASAHPTDPSPPEKCPDLTYLLRQPPNPPESRAISHELGSQLIVMRPGLDLETPYEPRFHTPTPCADHFSRPNSRCLHFDPKNGNHSIRSEDGLPGCEQPLTTTVFNPPYHGYKVLLLGTHPDSFLRTSQEKGAPTHPAPLPLPYLEIRVINAVIDETRW